MIYINEPEKQLQKSNNSSLTEHILTKHPGKTLITQDTKVEYDAATKEWFEQRPAYAVTTVARCERCGLYFKPSLGHKIEHCIVEE